MKLGGVVGVVGGVGGERCGIRHLDRGGVIFAVEMSRLAFFSLPLYKQRGKGECT